MITVAADIRRQTKKQDRRERSLAQKEQRKEKVREGRCSRLGSFSLDPTTGIPPSILEESKATTTDDSDEDEDEDEEEEEEEEEEEVEVEGGGGGIRRAGEEIAVTTGSEKGSDGDEAYFGGRRIKPEKIVPNGSVAAIVPLPPVSVGRQRIPTDPITAKTQGLVSRNESQNSFNLGLASDTSTTGTIRGAAATDRPRGPGL
jgi:hypothetical protein